MIRSFEVTIAGTVYDMPVTMAAAMKVVETVGDPLEMARAMASEKMLTLSQVIGIVAAGVRCAGANLSTEQIGEHIIEAGAMNYLTVASQYLLAMVSGSPEKPVRDSKKKRSG